MRLPSHKLSPKYVGPYQVLRRVNLTLTYELRLHLKIHPVFHISCLKPTVTGPLDDGEVNPMEPAAIEVEMEPAYRVKELLDSQRRQGGGGGLQYLVDWEGCGSEERSWVLAWDIKYDFHNLWLLAQEDALVRLRWEWGLF